MGYDLAIIGSGAAAFAGAITAVEGAARVAMIERGEIGGTCVDAPLPLQAVPRAIVNRDTRGVIKLVAEAGTGRVRGVHAVADGARELITAGVYAIRAGMTIEDLAGTWAPYLTMSEALRLAAQSFSRDVTKLSCCAA
jgi:mercuric reductase